MFFYQCKLAWRSIRKNPFFCGLMALTLACGVAATMMCYTVYHTININPLAYKDDRLFMVQTDSWHLQEPFAGKALNAMPDLLSYRDVKALMRSDIPLRKAAMTRWGGILSIPDSDTEPRFASARITTGDYFNMFDVRFLHGSAWDNTADNKVKNLIIINETINNHFFQGKNSLGEKILLEGYLYTIQGIVKNETAPSNKMQNIDTGILMSTEDIYLPFGLLAEREIYSWNLVQRPDDLLIYGDNEYQNSLNSANLWLTYWVEFSDKNDKQQYENFITAYIERQKKIGYYPRPLNFALSNATQKLKINGYNQGKFRELTKFGIGFLVVCIANCITLLLAKFLRYSSESAICRALGASRTTIFLQHLIECSIIGIFGCILALLLTYGGLVFLHQEFSDVMEENSFFMGNIANLFALDIHIFIATIIAAIGSSLLAGIYPAWRICHAPIAQQLKLQ